MLNNEKDDEDIENMSIANFLDIIKKAYKLYLNQEIENLNITLEQIPFIIELDKNEGISKKNLAKYLFLSDKNTIEDLMDLYKLGIIDKKSFHEKSLGNENHNFDLELKHYENLYGDYNKKELDVYLTSHGKEIAQKIKEIDIKWKELIHENLESSNKDEIMKNIKNLAISSSFKINNEITMFNSEFGIFKGRKMIDKC